MEKKETIEKMWYDSPSFIINAAIIFNIIMIVLSQAFAVNNELTTNEMMRNLLNHNVIYIIGLIYFIPLKFQMGKKYFHYFNIFFIIIYFIFTITSVLTMIQSFGLNSLLNFIIHLILLIYMSHNLLKNTRIWKELKMELSPLYEISNENYFYTIIVLSMIVLAVNLIESTTFDGVILSLLATIYNILLARYICLYQIHLEQQEKGIFEEIDQVSKDLPKLKTITKEVQKKKLNHYQYLSIITFCICFVVGIVFGNIFPSCSTTTGIFESTCTTTEFNFSLTITIWFISFLVCVLFYGLGQIISLLESINKSLSKRK